LLLQNGKGRSLGLISEGLTLRADGGEIAGLSTGLVSELWISPESATGSLWLQQRRYRGRLQLLVSNGRMQAINRLGIESYLPSVVGAEMPPQWPLEALRVQSVAARSYALRQLRPEATYDLKATVSSQVYRGLESETDSTREAVASTRSLVLTYANRVIDAVFHSSSGGYTENSGEVWPRQVPYLRSVADYDQASPVFRWTKQLDASTLLRSFREIGGVESIQPLQTTSTGRLTKVLVRGPEGELRIGASELRSRLGLRSTYVKFEVPPPASAPLEALGDWLGLPPPPRLLALGRGYGHGVGMSQWGAYGMAQQGQEFGQILRHYYRGTKLEPYNPVDWPNTPPLP
jgi:stage II sporulation protein D